MKKLYIKVSDDKYRLPEAIADSPSELARLVGVTKNAVSSALSHKLKNSRYIAVNIEEDEDETCKRNPGAGIHAAKSKSGKGGIV